MPLEMWDSALSYANRADLAPGEDQVAVSHRDGSVRLYSLDGVALHERLVHDEARALDVTRAVLSRGGDQMLTSGADGIVKLWRRAADGEWQARVLTVFSQRVRNVHFDSEERRVVAGADDGVLRVLDLDGRVLHQFTYGDGMFHCAQFTPDGHEVVATTSDGRMQSWFLDRDALLAAARALRVRELTVQEQAAHAELLGGRR